MDPRCWWHVAFQKLHFAGGGITSPGAVEGAVATGGGSRRVSDIAGAPAIGEDRRAVVGGSAAVSRVFVYASPAVSSSDSLHGSDSSISVAGSTSQLAAINASDAALGQKPAETISSSACHGSSLVDMGAPGPGLEGVQWARCCAHESVHRLEWRAAS